MEKLLNNKRFHKLNDKTVSKNGKFVLYYVTTSPRVNYNYSLKLAKKLANKLNVGVICYFELNTNFTHSNKRNFTFLIQGLKDFKKSLKGEKVTLITGENKNSHLNYLVSNCSVVVCDYGYLNFHKAILSSLSLINKQVIAVENNVVFPIKEVSNKREYAHRFYKTKAKKILKKYLVTEKQVRVKKPSPKVKIKSVKLNKFLQTVNFNERVEVVNNFIGGEEQAKKHLILFINKNLKNYKKYRNDPTKKVQSNLSPYLHFGHISPIFIALQILKKHSKKDEFVDDFFNELIYWRELAKNFVYYSSDYNKYSTLPTWAKKTLKTHKNDKRQYIYNLSDLENAKTHDNAWNATQKELLKVGKMSGYMRMYWGKKIIEWTNNPTTAFKWAIYLNDKYSLDGRDENGYAGVAWCFGLHDRPWFKREVLGTVRYMAKSGLQKKFNLQSYINYVNKL